MNNSTIQERLMLLRLAMESNKIDYYMIPTADYHSSEYVHEYFKVREYFCGFTGSNGTLLVWKDGAGLWTDGRYFIQAEKELEGSGVTLYRMQEEGVPTIEEFLAQQMQKNQTLGFDGRVISFKEGIRLEKILEEKQISINASKDLAKDIWMERPAFPKGKVYALSTMYTGKTVSEKLQQVRSWLVKKQVSALFLSKLDDIMWLFNIRGQDVNCNPVAMSYSYITENIAVLFVQKEACEDEIQQSLEKQGVIIEEYHSCESYIQNIKESISILLDDRYVSFAFYQYFQKKHCVHIGKNPTENLKAKKNPVELSNMRKIYLKDSIAVTKFIYWLKHYIGKETITEISAAEYLDQLRRSIPEFIDLSFPTISGYKGNAAMMHYEATKEAYAVLKPEGMLLVDSGGQYLLGTTDVTRTIALGPVSALERMHYTLTAVGMLQLKNACFPYGCTGRNLDVLARQPFWNRGLDYRCGTGHGVGYFLNVHEGPQGLRWRYNKDVEEALLEEGMVITNEPGVYVEGSHGIRIENVMVVKKKEKTEYGQFLCFETLTFVPLDKSLIEDQYLTEQTRQLLQEYQTQVYEKIAAYLTEEERHWLAEECNIKIL